MSGQDQAERPLQITRFMPSWLVDNPRDVFLVLGLAAVGLGIGWWRTRRPGYALGLVLVALALLIVLGLWYLVDTDAKQIQYKVKAMTDAVAAGSVDKIFAHVSDQFSLQGRLKKDQFRERVERHIRGNDVTKIEVWRFEPLEISRAERNAVVIFKVKAEGSAFRGYEFFNCKATFVLDPDEQWRLKDFRLYWPQIDPRTGEDLHLPF
jgi:hypothetical protein